MSRLSKWIMFMRSRTGDSLHLKVKGDISLARGSHTVGTFPFDGRLPGLLLGVYIIINITKINW